MSKNEYTTRVVQYKEDPKQSNALAEIKRLSNQAKNKSSRNLIYIKDKLDIDTETNTERNKNMFKENNETNTFQRRKRQFATQISKPSIANEVKKKSNLKKWQGLFDNNDDSDNKDINEGNFNKKKNKNNKHVDFTVNYNNRKGVTNNNDPKKNYYTNKTYNVNNKSNNRETDEDNINPINRKRKISSDERETISQRIVLYLDNPKDSSALAEIKRISNQAKKNKTSKNLIHINPDELINSPKDTEAKDKDKPVQSFKRRKFQFATTVYVPKKNNLTLLDELHNKYKNVQVNNNEEKEFKESGSEDDESEDSIFNLDKLDKEESKEQKEENKENKKLNITNNKNEEPKKDTAVKETKEERTPIQVNRNNNNKGRTLLEERYKKIEPRNDRLKYSSNTVNVSEINRYSNRRNDYMPRASFTLNTITEEYKKDNNLTVENRNTKELIIKNEYGNKNKERKGLKTYKTEYFWDKMINRLVERRIYLDENELTNNKVNTKYSNNTFNPFSKYRKDFETKENENNVTKEKIELDKEDKESNITVKNNNKIPFSRKYKYLPHLYTSNTFRPVKNVNDNKETLNQNIETPSKPSYKVYQKRQIIPTKEELKENNPQKNRTVIYNKEENVKYIKRLPKKDLEERKKIYPRNVPNPQVKSEKNKKNDEVKFKKIIQPYSSNITNTKRKIIRLNVHPGENEGSITDRNNNNNIYSNYMRSQRTTKLTHNNSNSELIEDLEKIEQYSVNTYLKNDLLEIYGTIDEEFKDFKKGVFNTNLNRFETKMAEFDNIDEIIKKKKKFDVNNLCKGKTTTDDIYRKYKKRAIKIERGTYNN